MNIKDDSDYLRRKEEILKTQELAEKKLRKVLGYAPEDIVALEAIRQQIRNTQDDIYRVKIQIRNNSLEKKLNRR